MQAVYTRRRIGGQIPKRRKLTTKGNSQVLVTQQTKEVHRVLSIYLGSLVFNPKRHRGVALILSLCFLQMAF